MTLKLFIFVALSTISFGLFAQDEIISRHLGLCENFEARAFKTEGSTCQILVKNDVFPSQHFICKAEIGDGDIPDTCSIIVALVNNNGFLAFQCGKPGEEPVIQQQGVATSTSYHVSGLVIQPSGFSRVIRDSAQYTFIYSELISLSFVEKFKALRDIKMSFGGNEFRNVTCR